MKELDAFSRGPNGEMFDPDNKPMIWMNFDSGDVYTHIITDVDGMNKIVFSLSDPNTKSVIDEHIEDVHKNSSDEKKEFMKKRIFDLYMFCKEKMLK